MPLGRHEENTMKKIYIDLTDEQICQLAPIEKVLEQHNGPGPRIATIGQVMFYHTGVVLIVGVLNAELTAQIGALTMSVDKDRRLLDLPEA
jgi:hypothetical protein